MEGLVSPSFQYLWFPVDRVGLLGGGVILFVDLDGLVSLAGNQAGPEDNDVSLQKKNINLTLNDQISFACRINECDFGNVHSCRNSIKHLSYPNGQTAIHWRRKEETV